MPFAQIVSPFPAPEAPPEVAAQSALSEAPGFGENLAAQNRESFIGRHLPGQNYGDIVQDWQQSWDSERRRKLAVDQGLYENEAALPPRSGQPLLSADEANARYSFEGPDGKQVKIASEPVPDDVAREQSARAQEKMRHQSIMARFNAAHSWDTPLGNIPTPYGFATQLLTPDTAAMALVPGVGEEALLAKLGTGFVPRTAARAVSGATTFAAGSGAMMAADALLPDWRGEKAEFSLRQAMNELYSSAAQGAIMHAAINPAFGAAWRKGKQIALQRAGKLSEAGEAPAAPSVPPAPAAPVEEPQSEAGAAPAPAPASIAAVPAKETPAVPPPAVEKPLGDIAKALAEFESADGPAKRAAMDTATGQVLEGKPVEVRPHFDPATSEEVIQEQARQDRDGYAPGIDAATLAEETAKVYTPPKPEPEKFEKEMGGPVGVAEDPAAAWAAARTEHARLSRERDLLEEGARRWAESGAQSPFPQGPLLAETMNRLRILKPELAAMPQERAPGPLERPAETAAPDAAKVTGESMPQHGMTGEISTPDGSMRLPVTAQVVELSSLTHASDELQPRDRSRAESAIGVQERAANLDPRRLMPMPTSDIGSPAVASDGTILSGNGRVISLREVYSNPALKERADAYREALGPAAQGMKEPVLVMRLPENMPAEEKARFADLSNRTQIAALSATERAVRDARVLGTDAFAEYRGGDLNSGANRPFLQRFIAGAVTPEERGAFSKDGMLTKEGRDRVEAAVLAAAYGDSSTLSLMLESTEDNIRAITNAMRDAAGDFARLRAGIEAGIVKPDVDTAPQLLEAIKLISYLREKGIKPREYFGQADMFAQRDILVENWVRALYKDDLSRALPQKDITDILISYAQESAKHQTVGLIEDATTAAEILASSVARRARERAGLFALGEADHGESLPGGRGENPEPGTPAIGGGPGEHAPLSATDQRGVKLPAPEQGGLFGEREPANAKVHAELTEGMDAEKPAKAEEPPAPVEQKTRKRQRKARKEPEAAETPTAAKSAEPPQWAVNHANDVGGTVIWHEGDLALIRCFSVLTGNNLYAAAKEGVGRTRVDVSLYTGGAFPYEDIIKLDSARKRAIAADEAAHQANPDGPFAGGATFAASPSVPKELAGYAQDMLRQLGINARVYLTTVKDAQAEDFHGPFAAIGSAGLDQNSDGTTRKLSNGDHYIALKIGSRMSGNIEVLAHEMGHIFEKEEWSKADAGTKSAIRADFEKWLFEVRGGNAKELVESLRAHTTGKTTTILDPELQATRLPVYWRSFGEWFADNVAKWAVSSEKPLSLAEKFFSRLASALRSFYSSLAGEKYLPAKSVKEWLDSRGPSEPLQGAVAGPGAEDLSAQHSLSATPAREPSPAEQMEAFANPAMRFLISKAGPDINALLKPFARELDAFGRKTTSEDALAFFRAYFTQPSAAQSLAPGFARAIEQLFDKIDPKAHADFVARAREHEASMQPMGGEPSEEKPQAAPGKDEGDTAATSGNGREGGQETGHGLPAETAKQLAKFENILKTFDKRSLLPEELGELEQTEKDLAAAATPEEKKAAAERRADAIVNAVARKDRMSDVQSTGQGARGAWLALASDMHGTWRGWRDSVEAQWRALTQVWHAVVDNQVRQAGLNNLAAKGLQDREVNRELWKLNASQGKSGMPAGEGSPARQLAEILWPALRTAKDRVNEAGGRIADALDYVLSTYHDPYKLRRAAGYTDGKWWQVGPAQPLAAVEDAFKAWWKFVLPRLNHVKTFSELTPEEGETIEAARDRFGRSVFNSLITGVHMRFGGEISADESGMAYMQPAFEGTHNIARALSHHRVLFWKDADSWTDYHERFGPATTTTHMVMQHLDSSARATALMNHWGTNPAANLNLVIQKVQHEYRNSDPDGVVEFEKKIKGLQNVMAHLDGSANMPGNEMWASINRAYRSEYSASVLGATGLTHLVTLPWTVPSELKRHGIDRWQSLSMLLQRLVTDATGRGDDARREVLAELGALPDSINRQLQRQFQPWGKDSPLNTMTGWASSLAANVMKYNGLNYFFDTSQTMARESIAAKVATNLGKDYSALDPRHQQMLGLYGIGEKEWNLLRTAKPSEANGISYLTPGDVRRISDEQFDGYTKEKADEYRAKIEESRQKFEAADAREAEWHQARMGNLNTKIASLTDWIAAKAATRDATWKNRMLLKLAQVDEMKNHIETIEAATDLMQSLKGLGVQDRVQQFLEDVEGGAQSWKAAQAAGRVIERGARSNLSAGERLGEQRAKIEAKISDIIGNLGGAEVDAKAKADLEWLDGRIAELRQGVEEANDRMHGRISARAERLNEMAEERLPQLIAELRRDARDRLSDQLGSYYSETAHRSTIGSSVRERAALLKDTKPGTFWGEVARHSLLYKMWPVAQFFQGLARDWYLSGTNGERAMNLFYMIGLGTFGGLMRMSINDLMRGNPQRDPSDPKTLIAALAQGGGLGIYGDFLFGETARNGAGLLATLGGPAASDLGKLGHLYSNAWNYELDQTGHRKNTGPGDIAQLLTSKIPLHNLIYLNAAMNYLLFYHLYESLDPGWWARTNHRLAKERGRAMVGFRPGAGVPFGVPPLYLQTPSGHSEGLLAGN